MHVINIYNSFMHYKKDPCNSKGSQHIVLSLQKQKSHNSYMAHMEKSVSRTLKPSVFTRKQAKSAHRNKSHSYLLVKLDLYKQALMVTLKVNK